MNDPHAQGKEMSAFNGSVTESKHPSGFRHIWFPGIFLLLLVLIFEFTDLDLWCSDIFYDFNNGRFYWRDTWWANQLLHKGGLYAIASVLIASSTVKSNKLM